jgi:hypothetical protein
MHLLQAGVFTRDTMYLKSVINCLGLGQSSPAKTISRLSCGVADTQLGRGRGISSGACLHRRDHQLHRQEGKNYRDFSRIPRMIRRLTIQ